MCSYINNNYKQVGKIKSTIHVFESKHGNGINSQEWNDFTTSGIKHYPIEGDHWQALSINNYSQYIIVLIKLVVLEH